MPKLYQVLEMFWEHLKWDHGKLKGAAVVKPKPGCPDCQRLGMDWT